MRKQETTFKVKLEFAEACSYTVAIPKTEKKETYIKNPSYIGNQGIRIKFITAFLQRGRAVI